MSPGGQRRTRCHLGSAAGTLGGIVASASATPAWSPSGGRSHRLLSLGRRFSASDGLHSIQ